MQTFDIVANLQCNSSPRHFDNLLLWLLRSVLALISTSNPTQLSCRQKVYPLDSEIIFDLAHEFEDEGRYRRDENTWLSKSFSAIENSREIISLSRRLKTSSACGVRCELDGTNLIDSRFGSETRDELGPARADLLRSFSGVRKCEAVIREKVACGASEDQVRADYAWLVDRKLIYQGKLRSVAIPLLTPPREKVPYQKILGECDVQI